MNRYEGMFLLKPDLNKEQIDNVLSQIKEAIAKHKGSIVEIREWSKQRLAYPIKKYKEGIYYLINFHIDSDAVSKIERFFGLNETILRVLIIRGK